MTWSIDMLGTRSLLVVTLALVVASVVAHSQTKATPTAGAWRSFNGEWSATGQVATLQTEGERPAAIIQLSGALVLGGHEGLSRGFRGEIIAFDDGRDVTGRAVWTDEHGDRVFSELKGGPVLTGRHFAGTITGGTGRYAGLAGDYEFTWQYVLTADEGVMQGRAVQLKGRVRGGRQ